MPPLIPIDGTPLTIFGVRAALTDTGGDVPLASKHFTYPDLPYHADSGDGPRGTQQVSNTPSLRVPGDSVSSV